MSLISRIRHVPEPREGPAEPMSARDEQKARALGLTSATGLVIGSIIGTGVFTMPAVLAGAGTITALRSLFLFAKRRGLIFADPTAHLTGGRAAERTLLPMTAEEIQAVQQAALTPAQRLAISLAAVHAARPKAIRELTLDDIDLPSRRITLAGHRQRLGEFTHTTLLAWLEYQHATWPHTTNRHVLVTRISALGTGPVSADYLDKHQLRGICLDHIRRDRILHEALATGADPPPRLDLQHRPHQRDGLRQRRPQPAHQPSRAATPSHLTGAAITGHTCHLRSGTLWPMHRRGRSGGW